MDPELSALIERLGNTDNPLTDEELVELQTQIVARIADIDPATASDDDLIVLREAAEHSATIRSEQDTRAASQAERAAAAAALLAEITPVAETPEDPESGDTAPEGGETAPEGGEPAPAEPEAPSATVAEVPIVDGGEIAEPTPVPIAAATTPPVPERLPRISRLAARRPATHKPVPTATTRASRAVLVAAADMPGLPLGQEVEIEALAASALRRYDALRGVRTAEGDGEKVPFGTIRVEYPDDRNLDDNEQSNEAKIDAIVGRDALVASGGICSPVAVDYNVSSIGTAARPVRDGLAQFGATRGGLRYILPHTLAQVTADGPSVVWTAANDVALNNPALKPHATFSCQPVQEALVDAVTSIVQFGNFQSRYFPEQIAQYLETVDTVHARLAEATSLAAMTAGSTAVNAGVNLLGAASEVLAEIDRAVAGYRFRHRMAVDAPLRVMYPEWLEDLIRADLAREAPGNSGGQSERLAVADAEIDRFFAIRNLNTSEYIDSPTGATPFQGFGVQGAGDLLPWPSKVIIYIFHEGAWMFLDGGELNLGMVRDSTLNKTNDFQMFSETFEKTIFRGHESLALTLDTCVSGQRANLVDTSSYCTSGS